MKKLPTKEELEAKLVTDAPDWWNGLPIGHTNIYTCGECSHYICTIDTDRGVTPMYISCEQCTTGYKASSFYRNPNNISPTHMWYRPEGKELKKLLSNPATRSHYLNGGLSLKEIEQ